MTELVSFSGIDGAGKSTQIESLSRRMKEKGRSVRIIRFWDDITTLKKLREATGHRIFKGDKGVGSPERPINRRDKNVQSWPMTVVRLGIYALDAFSLRTAAQKARRSGTDLVIFDRYIYDELSNLPLSNRVIRVYVWLILMLVPVPEISYLIDADPAMARVRKPEYPIDFLYTSRDSYLTLAGIVREITVIEPSQIQEVELAIWKHTRERLLVDFTTED